ncbi:MAG: DUF5683 domain-containing protein [Leptospiraceae bacterium]|nr:hypothetical protein [Leptospiraceae bacterium]MCK6380772.1 DUF5683 domain-containing protein [Leptospiraceae bacterium]NUM41142.1 hypothetical protein [Leptospiraceae bacterium]
MKGKINTLSQILTFFSILTAFPLLSETILLRNGETLKGKILNQNYSKIFLETKDKDGTGEPKTIEVSKADIQKVIYKDVDNDEIARLRKLEEDKLSDEEERKKKEEEDLSAKQRAEEEERQRQADLERRRTLWESKQVTRFGSLGRSAILPGWGQYENDRKTTGLIYGALFFSSAFLLYNKNREYLNAKRDYENYGNPYSESQYYTNFYGASTATVSSTSLNDPVGAYLYYNTNSSILQRQAVEKHYSEVKRLGYLVAGIYIINLLDAFFRHETKTFTGDRGFFMDYSVARTSSLGYSPNVSSQIDKFYTFGYKADFDFQSIK